MKLRDEKGRDVLARGVGPFRSPPRRESRLSFFDSSRSNLFQLVLCRYLYRLVKRAIDRAVVGVHRVHALNRFTRLGRSLQVVDDVNASYDQDLILRLYLARHLRRQALAARVDLARLQRAPEGSRESTASGGNDVIERRGVRLRDLRAHAVVFGDRAVHAERDRLALGGQMGETQRPPFALDPDL